MSDRFGVDIKWVNGLTQLGEDEIENQIYYCTVQQFIIFLFSYYCSFVLMAISTEDIYEVIGTFFIQHFNLNMFLLD